MKKLLIATVICSLITLFSCTKPSGIEVTEHFTAPNNYYSLYISDGMDVVVTDEVSDIVITADENVMQKIKVTCKNGRLKITRKDFSVYRIMKAKVLIPYNSHLHELDVEMCSSFTSGYGLEGEDIKITANYHSEIDINYILANNLKLKLEYYSEFEGDVDVMDLTELTMSDSEAEIIGATTELYMNLKDNSELEEHLDHGAYAFECNVGYGTMSKECKAYLHCYDNLAVNLTNESFLYCTGEPNIDECDWDATSGIIFR